MIRRQAAASIHWQVMGASGTLVRARSGAIMTQAMVCAAQPEAVEAGAEVLADGGNAVDAAVATALTQTAVDPQMCGIAGFGSMHIYVPGGAHTCIDFYGRAPLAATPDMWLDQLVGETEDGFGFILKDRENELGY